MLNDVLQSWHAAKPACLLAQALITFLTFSSTTEYSLNNGTPMNLIPRNRTENATVQVKIKTPDSRIFT